MNRPVWIVLLWAANAVAQISGFQPLSSPEISKLLGKARSGNLESQLRLGTAYQFGLGVNADPQTAEYWLKLAAGFGDPQAQTQLGLLYLQPEFAASRDQALKWFLRAVAGGSIHAEHNLGVMYMRGVGVKQDREQAIRWFRRAAEHGLPEANIDLGLLLVAATDPGQQKEGFEIISAIARKEEKADAENALAYCYERGTGTEANLPLAVEWYKRAATHGSLMAMTNLADLYYTGVGVEQNFNEAFQWSRKACELGRANACFAVASAYVNAKGVTRDYLKAYQFALMAGVDESKIRLLSEHLTAEARSKAEDEAERWKQNHILQLSTLPK